MEINLKETKAHDDALAHMDYSVPWLTFPRDVQLPKSHQLD